MAGARLASCAPGKISLPRAMQEPLAPPSAERRPVTADASRPCPHRRLCLAAGGELAGGDAQPGGAARRHPRLSRCGERLVPRRHGRHRGAAGGALQGDARAHQGGQFDRPRARRPLCLRRALRRGRPASAATCAQPRDGGAEEVLLDGNALAEGRAYFRLGGAAHAPDHRLLAWSHDDAGSEFYTLSVRDLETRPRPLRRHRRHRRLGGLVGRLPQPLLCPPRRQPPALARLPPRDRHRAARTTCSSTRRPIPASSSMSARRSRDRFIVIHDAATTRRREARLIPADAPESDADPRRAAPDRRRIRASTRRTARFFILTNAGGAKDFKIVTAPVAAPGRENWTRPRAARAGPAHPVAHRLCAPPRPAGARRRPAAHRRAPPRRRRGARHRLRRGGLFARPVRRLRVRHRHAALHLFVDGDAGARLRLRHGDARARAAQGAGDPLRPRPVALRDAAHLRARRGRREGADLAALPQGHAARRLGAALLYGYGAYGIAIPAAFSVSRAVAGRPRLRLRHRPYPRRQGQGLWLVRERQARAQGQHLLRFRRRRRASGRASATRRAERSSRRAARPAAC